MIIVYLAEFLLKLGWIFNFYCRQILRINAETSQNFDLNLFIKEDRDIALSLN